jgi:hypothetical protein
VSSDHHKDTNKLFVANDVQVRWTVAYGTCSLANFSCTQRGRLFYVPDVGKNILISSVLTLYRGRVAEFERYRAKI